MKEMNLQYLLLEIARIDVLIRRQVHLWELAGQNSKDQFRGLYITQSEASKISNRSFGMNWGSSVCLSPEIEIAYTSDYQSLQNQANQLVSKQSTPRLYALRQDFGLNSFEYDAFLISLAPAIDLRYERIFGFLQDDVTCKLPGVSLILDLLLPNDADRLKYLDYFAEDAALLHYGLVNFVDDNSQQKAPLLKRNLIASSEVISWLLGNYHPQEDLAEFISFELPNPQPEHLLVPQEAVTSPWLEIQKKHPLLAFCGPDDQHIDATARYVASSIGLPLLSIDLSALKASQHLTIKNIRGFLRDATMIHAIPFFTGWDCLLDDDHVVQKEFLSEIFQYKHLVITGCTDLWRIPGVELKNEKPVIWRTFSHPAAVQRTRLWKYYLGDDAQLTDEEICQVSNQFVLTSSQILSAVRSVRNMAHQQGRAITSVDLLDAARSNSTHHLDRLAVKIQPRYGWNDIVLPEDEMSVLHEISSTVRDRSLVLETWGLGKKLVSSSGISALFAGEPGTGKTLAAQVIASELNMDLYKIDLSTIVSKYIGDTEKNLEQIFSQARNSNSILFFDEADAIFGKRSEVKDAHDRYANIEVGYLLQRMETYDGIVILATNLRSNIDDAFTRRLQFVVDFPFPDENQRAEIWKVLFPAGVPRDENIDFAYFAKQFKLSGGSIRNIIVSASFKAASEKKPVNTRHLMQSVRRELKKNGRLINEKDLVIA